MFVMLVGPSDDIIESKIVIGPNLKLQKGGSSPLSPMLATPLLLRSSVHCALLRRSGIRERIEPGRQSGYNGLESQFQEFRIVHRLQITQ